MYLWPLTFTIENITFLSIFTIGTAILFGLAGYLYIKWSLNKELKNAKVLSTVSPVTNHGDCTENYEDNGINYKLFIIQTL